MGKCEVSNIFQSRHSLCHSRGYSCRVLAFSQSCLYTFKFYYYKYEILYMNQIICIFFKCVFFTLGVECVTLAIATLTTKYFVFRTQLHGYITLVHFLNCCVLLHILKISLSIPTLVGI